jgi:hypothetical protein
MSPELTKELNDLLVTIVSILTTTILPLLVYYLVQWLRAKIANVKNAEVRDALNDALSRLDLTAKTVVAELNQTMRDKVAADGGKLTQKTAQELLQVAYTRTKSRLPADAMATLQATFSDRSDGENLLKKVIVGKIEKTVGDAKTPCVISSSTTG